MMGNKRHTTSGRRGFALMYTAIALMALTLFVGLAIDATVLFLVRAKLSAAVDAAALGAGRSLNLADDQTTASNLAASTAQSFFLANFPQNYMGAATINPATAISTTFTPVKDTNNNNTGIITITTTATVQAPTYFMRILGWNKIPIGASGSATRRGLVLMLTLDISSSMNTAYNGTNACDAMKNAAVGFVSNFGPYDVIGLVAFNGTAHLYYTPTNLWGQANNVGVNANQRLVDVISGLNCSSNTNTTAAIKLAGDQIKSVNLPLAMNTIMLFTDGMPNAISVNGWPVRTVKDTRYSWSNNPPAGCPGSDSQTCLMPVCAAAGSVVNGALAQGSGYASTGSTSGLFQDFDTDSYSTAVPGGCTSGTGLKQVIAYIPATDRFGNITTQFLPANTPDLAGFHDGWLFQTNKECDGSNCANAGDLWSNHAGTGSGSNFFPNTNEAPANRRQLRPDQPNTIGVASMNAAVQMAQTVRGYKNASNTLYNITIHSIYLLKDDPNSGPPGADPVDQYFLPIVSNLQDIPSLPNFTGSASMTNGAYVTGQQTGEFLVASDSSQLNQLFAQIASQILRLSQ